MSVYECRHAGDGTFQVMVDGQVIGAGALPSWFQRWSFLDRLAERRAERWHRREVRGILEAWRDA